MRKCLGKYKQGIIWSDYDLLIKTYLFRIEQLFADLQCQLHDHDSIIALCIDPNCDEFQKILCLKCIMNDHTHADVLVIQEIKQKREKLFKLLIYLSNNSNHTPEYTWLQSCILRGDMLPYPSVTFENVFNQLQDTFIANMDDVRSQVEKSVHSLQGNSKQLQKIQQFKRKMEDLIKTTQSQIYLNFQSVLEEGSEQKSTDAKSMPQGFTNISNIEQSTYTINDFDFQNSIIKCDDSIIPLMPTLSFDDKSIKRGFLSSKPKVQFQEGGKLITMNKNALIVSKELYGQDNIEIRIRLLSFVSGCCHFGTVEQNAYQLTKNIDNVAFWGCLEGRCESRLNKVKDFSLPIDSIIGLNLNFQDDTIHIRLFTKEAVIILFEKSGCLMKQKQHIYITCLSEQIKFEVLN